MMKIRWVRGNAKIRFNRPHTFFVIGVRGSAKSTWLETIGEYYLEKGNGVQKAAWSIYLKASNDSARVGALRTVLEALEIHRDIVQTMDVLDRLDQLEEVAKERDNEFRRGGGSLH
jgi:predicted ATPase